MDRSQPAEDDPELGRRLAEVRRDERRGADVPLALARARAFQALFEEPRPARTLGRYLVLERIGAGAMGVVYAAHDAELDRKVALKLVRETECGRDAVAARRLIREAQALAKLAHPNVVAVHDAGTVEASLGDPIVESESTLRSIDATSSDARPSDGVVESSSRRDAVFIAMEFVDGTTLRHWSQQTRPGWRAGLEVLVQAGRGLAAAHRAGLVHRDFKPDNVMVGRDGRVRVMDFGLVAPIEVARTDPLGDTHAQPELAALELAMTRVGAAVGTPTYMAAEQFRGAHADARSDQFAFCVTAWELLHTMRPYEGSNVPGLAANVIAGRRAPVSAGIRVPRWLRRVLDRGLLPDPEHRWPSMDALLDALARGRRFARVRPWLGIATAFAIGGGAVGAAERIGRARALGECAREGESIRGIWNDESRDRMRADFDATGVHGVAAAHGVAAQLFDAAASAWQDARQQACVRTEVDRTWDPDTGQRAVECLMRERLAMEQLLAELAVGNAADVAWAPRLAEIVPASHACIDPAVAGWGTGPGLVAPHRAHALGDLAEAERLTVADYFDAVASQSYASALDASTRLVDIERMRGRVDSALDWARHGDLLILRHPGDRLRAVRLALARAGLADDLGDWTRGAQELERAHDGLVALYDAPSVALVDVWVGWAAHERAMGDLDAARDALELAIAALEGAMGRDHLAVARLRNALGDADLHAGSTNDARVEIDRALAIARRSTLALAEVGARAHALLARARIGEGRFDLAEMHLAEAMRLCAHDDGRVLVGAGVRAQLAELRLLQGRPAEAESVARDAIARLERTVGSEARAYADVELRLGRALVGRAPERRVIETLEHAVAIYERHHDAAGTAAGRLALAEARWESDHDPARALAEAEAAVVAFEQAGRWDEMGRAQAWLAARGDR